MGGARFAVDGIVGDLNSFPDDSDENVIKYYVRVDFIGGNHGVMTTKGVFESLKEGQEVRISGPLVITKKGMRFGDTVINPAKASSSRAAS